MPNVEWWERPVQKPRDLHDPEEHEAVAAALSPLPSDHPARRAYAEGADTIALTHLVPVNGYPHVVEALKNAYLEGYSRQLQRRGSSFRP